MLNTLIQYKPPKTHPEHYHVPPLQALLEAARSGELPGVKGRLGDLGAIDPRYDVAASTAAPALDYIVVNTTATAQRCVELLRRRQLGVATFLILEKQRHLAAAAQARVQTPEGAPLAD